MRNGGNIWILFSIWKFLPWNNLPTWVLSVLALCLVIYFFYSRFLSYKEKKDCNDHEVRVYEIKTEQLRIVADTALKMQQSKDSERALNEILTKDEIDSFELREQIEKELKGKILSTLHDVLSDEQSPKVTPVRRSQDGNLKQSSGDRWGVYKFEDSILYHSNSYIKPWS